MQIESLQLEGCTFDGTKLHENLRDSPSISAVPVCTLAWLPKVIFSQITAAIVANDQLPNSLGLVYCVTFSLFLIHIGSQTHSMLESCLMHYSPSPMVVCIKRLGLSCSGYHIGKSATIASDEDVRVEYMLISVN